ncbi:hypothetical protein LCGC14_0362110 [marine sediment metagenome]|uniref:Uncharacterized protein n=1 Tax=marine sediment metagenome TaxID=412755 RepID=A0A0F9WFW6_9ZZZZ
MADEKTWKLSEIRELFRKLTGRRSTEQISDENANKEINDYYTNGHFSHDAKVDEFDTFFTQALSATDDGEYTLDQSIDRLDDPITINGNRIRFYRDRELFFSGEHLDTQHHRFRFLSLTVSHNTHFTKFEDEQFITEPTLVIGSSDSKKVKHSNFDYNIDVFAYSKLSSEVALTGDAIPEDKYGAWSLKIDTDGDITVAAADDNVTGYDTPRKALEALDNSDSDSAYMGYVTVMKSDGAFTPDTTALDAANVTATFTDGRFENRSTPISALLYGTKLFVHPKPNDIYEFKALHIADRPTAFADDNAVPPDRKWGPVIATGAALRFLRQRGEDVEGVLEFGRGDITSVRSDKIKRFVGQVVQRTF